MELKNYQKDVISDLSRFLALLTEKQSISGAYNSLWEEKNVKVGIGGMPYYQDTLPGVPQVCLKVPTGGGKTFIAANAIKPIFDSMPAMRAKAVAWLVPSDAILTQTYAALNNPDHPYRQKIAVDFSSRVEVYSKEQLLNRQNFYPDGVTEQLSVFVLSYDSFRTSRKDGRKAYQQNSSLTSFAKQMTDKSMLLPEIDETALIQVVRSLNPVVIVDESHHATSDLSIEMLQNFNPCFVLDLTATPKSGSNIISFVDAVQLKKENMVKLPVIVYNRKSQEDVYGDAIHIRAKLEAQATLEQKTTGRYIRPIVLFQAQPKNAEDSTTYQKIKDTLIDAGIPEEQIRIKTADKDELKNVDLMSPDCPVRYIITVNALKEGWDCPFAYVLATVANRTSAVDVEQILGRVLRLPYTKKNDSNVLNISYVITSSADFHRTVENVVKGLNDAGFSASDYRISGADLEQEQNAPFQPGIQLGIDQADEEDNIPEIDSSELKTRVTEAINPDSAADTKTIESDELLSAALAQNEEYENEFAAAEETAVNLAPREVRDKMNVFRMNEEYAEEAATLEIPQFMLKTAPNLFSEETYTKLESEHLTYGFTLKDKDTQIDFSTPDAEMARVDIEDAKGSTPKAWKLTGRESSGLKELFSGQPSNVRLSACKANIMSKLSKLNFVSDNELIDYINRVVDNLTADQLADFEQSPYPYAIKVEKKIKALLSEHRAKIFDLWVEQDEIVCLPHYKLPSAISPLKFTSIIPKSLYAAEEEMNEYEYKVVWQLSSMDNIKWWHRNISRRGFHINGSTNAYPDIMVMTQSGKLILVETKGDYLDNAESKEKAGIGARWASLSGSDFRYFMVFESKNPSYPGAYSYDRFMEIVKEL